jgi:tetratricopeptide (TPR) repeat protein
MSNTSFTAPSSRPVGGLGERLRALRLGASMTQSELAGERFSKEYVSQIERGKTRPTQETVAWLAERLGVDPAFLAHGVSSDERGRVEAILVRAEALSAAHRYPEAIEGFSAALAAVQGTGSIELEVRVRAADGWARMQDGDVRTAIGTLQAARSLADAPQFSDVDRADILFRLGACRLKLGSVATAIALFDEALELAERSGYPSDVLRARILQWRSRGHRRRRDFEAAREDVERALELAQGIGDQATMAGVYFQASLVAERMGHWVLSRNYAQQARALYQELNDERNVGRLMLNLGGLHLLLGKPEEALEHLKTSFALAIEAQSQADAAQALGSMATVYLQLEQYDEADEHARKALELLAGREDFLDEVGQSQLVLGRSLMERGRLDEAEECFRGADDAFERLSSVSHRAGAWVALGDLAARRGDDREAARLYRNAAQALQDIRF